MKSCIRSWVHNTLEYTIHWSTQYTGVHNTLKSRVQNKLEFKESGNQWGLKRRGLLSITYIYIYFERLKLSSSPPEKIRSIDRIQFHRIRPWFVIYPIKDGFDDRSDIGLIGKFWTVQGDYWSGWVLVRGISPDDWY